MSEDDQHNLEPHQWVERYGDYLFNYAIVRVNDQEKAEDLVQETFLAGLKAMENFQGKSTERTWLISILKRKIIDTYRKQYSSRETSMGEFEQDISDGDFYRSEDPFQGHWLEGKGPHSHSLMPEGEIEREEIMRIIQQCISYLPPNLASAFIMKMIDEAESDEICKELDITPSNLWVMLHRARLKMRKCVESKWLI
ncbi:MAG: sigma-70 family RNA polymerase sigma factor [Bacteroidales bacterium]|nr:sigma-70 family RNA polymerase sigma factor [Bacteroidales bacterium]